MTGVTTNTPPGWYKEPGHTGNGPAMERWWDGNTWTEYTRTAPVPDGAFGYPYSGGDVIAGGPGGNGGRRGTGTVVVAIVAALVLIGGVVAGILVLGKGDSKKDAKDKSTPTPSATLPRHSVPTPSDGGADGSGGSQGIPSTGGRAVDAYDGISLPVLDGWQGTSGQGGVGATLDMGQYSCPGDATQHCERGGVSAEPAALFKITGTDPQAAAKADIAPNATSSYGAKVYGPTTSHQEVASKSVTVAGQQGYMVRWKVSTQSGTEGYVESLVFPSPVTPSRLVVVRFGFDIGGQAPGPDVMDQITQGIEKDTSGGTDTGGSGTGV